VEFPTARIPATLDYPQDQDLIPQEICANPHCARPVGLAGVHVAGEGKICGTCFRQVKRGIIMDENYEMSHVWRK
jgi:hypothetical protein